MIRRQGVPRGLLLLASFAPLLASACGNPSSGAPGPAADTAAPSPPAAPSSTADSPSPSGAASATGAADSPSASASASAAPTTEPAASSDPAATGPCPAGMIRIEGGTFRRHKPGKHKTVTLPSYCIDRTEVTVAAYKECVREKKCSPRCLEIGRCTAVPTDADWPDPKEAVRASMFCNGSRSDRDGHPVNCVSFDEAKGYCQSREKRLPSGDEWEWAAVGNKPAPVFPWGTRAPDGEQLCWGRPWKRPSTCLPGTYAPDTTRDGVVDMAGNLTEWVVEGETRPLARLRGASWYSIDDGYVEAALWGFDSTSSRSEVFGFRCVKDVAVR